MSGTEKNLRLAVLMTCHNRVATTTTCLEALQRQEGFNGSIALFLLDDGSTDGTSQAAESLFPEATIIRGDGNLYWCGGMRTAFAQAIDGNFDFYLWLNDDTRLDQDAVARMYQTYLTASNQLGKSLIVVGSTRDEGSDGMSYGGWRLFSSKFFTVAWEKVLPDQNHWISCDTMNGNCVFIARAAVNLNGNLDPSFTHGMGDLDYGLRATAAGCQIVISPGYYGVCKANQGIGLWTDQQLPVLQRWQKLLGPKGLPLKEWMVFTRRHTGKLWVLHWLGPYLKFWLNALLHGLGIKK
jgi:GT2 family glycosyltransferase